MHLHRHRQCHVFRASKVLAAIGLSLLSLSGCATTGSATGSGKDSSGGSISTTQTESNTGRTDNPAAGRQPVAFVYGRQLTWADLTPSLVEAAGGQILADRVLDIGVEARLQQERIALTPEMIAAERQILLDSLSDNADTAMRLLNELRLRRGLGDARFASLLKRQASFRALVQPEIHITDTAVQQAYQATHGPRYEVRLIVVRTLVEASEVKRRAAAGESFIDLAIKLSIDSSRAQGGLLSPISPADPTYPEVIRIKLPSLKEGEVSDALTLPNSFAIIRLERKIEGDNVKFDDAKEAATLAVRRMFETQAMQRAKRDILRQANAVILDKSLDAGWKDQLDRLNKDSGN